MGVVVQEVGEHRVLNLSELTHLLPGIKCKKMIRLLKSSALCSADIFSYLDFITTNVLITHSFLQLTPSKRNTMDNRVLTFTLNKDTSNLSYGTSSVQSNICPLISWNSLAKKSRHKLGVR